MDTTANIITTMGIISDIVYNQDKGKDYFKIDINVEANGTTYKVIDHTPTDELGFNALLLKDGLIGEYVIAFRGTQEKINTKNIFKKDSKCLFLYQ